MATLGRRRALGQHFLNDANIVNAIASRGVEEALKHGCQTLLEIGPGKGAITNALIQGIAGSQGRIRQFILSERDAKLAHYWKNQKCPVPLRVEEGDFLELPTQKWLTPGLAVVSNLPYSAGTAIATRLASHRNEIPVMVLMFQAEVAQRLMAEPSTKARGSLSIWIQNGWDVVSLLKAPPRAFTPPPEVMSEVVVLTRREKLRVEIPPNPQAERLWESLLKSTFAQRRKMLRSSFPWRNALELSGVDGTKRAEALDWEEWRRLYEALLQSQT